MKKGFYTVLALWCMQSMAQTTVKDLAVQAWIEPQTDGTAWLRWNDAGHKKPITIHKKLPDASTWTLVATLPDTAKKYSLSAAELATVSEWRVNKNFLNSSNQITNYANGYLYAGLKVPAIAHRGRCLVLISQTAYDSLQTKIEKTLDYIAGDGWQLDTLVIAESSSASAVKQKITNWYNLHPTANHSLYILGHVAVPYSGLMTDINNGATFPVDGHTPDHDGALVCDGYYADVTGTFTDNGTQTTGTRAANKNSPNDGKWDQINLPTNAELEVGRVDFFDLPILGSETQLLSRYLDKIETYKTGKADIPMTAIYQDALGYFNGEGPGRSAYMYMPPTIGNNITVGNLLANARKNKYLFGHELGYGGYTQFINIASTASFTDSFNAVFNSCFGSYFGDWDVSNNVLRAVVAAPGFSLTNCWNGRPFLLFHHMALGKNIGYSVRSMLNNGVSDVVYPVLYAQGRAHISLIGDPTLRLQMVKPPTQIVANAQDDNRRVKITWTASAETNKLGYEIFRSNSRYGSYEKINKAVVVDNQFLDSNPVTGTNYYLVRTLKLDSNASGTYYNMSIGTPTMVTGIVNKINTLPAMQAAISPNPSNGALFIETYGIGNQVVEMQVIELSGKTVMQTHFKGHAQIKTELNNGVYIISLKTNNFAPYTRKVVIVK